jgi:NAD(P)-dependent dehydrogenase (short-subunit alcohol dehydrogenase family)
LTLPPADLRLAVDVGVTGAMVAAQEVAPAMREAGRGTLLLTGSVAADRASTSATAVGVAKAALRNLAQSLHKELAPAGVRVTTVTIDGVLQGPNALDLAEIADLYWRLHSQPEAPPAVVVHPS